MVEPQDKKVAGNSLRIADRRSVKVIQNELPAIFRGNLNSRNIDYTGTTGKRRWYVLPSNHSPLL